MIPLLYRAFKISETSYETPFLIQFQDCEEFDATEMTRDEIDFRLSVWRELGWSWEVLPA